MPVFDGKKPYSYVFELWVDRWRSLAAEKHLTGKSAAWALLDFIRNPALGKLQRRMGVRMREVDDPELLITELRRLYVTKENKQRAMEGFENRNQSKGEDLRDYMDTLQALFRESDQLASWVSINRAVSQRFLRGIRDPELMHPARKQLLHAYTCRLSEESEDYLEKVLEEAQSQKQGIRDFAKEQSARHKQERAYESKDRSPSRSGLTEISKEVACLRSALMKVTKALFQDNEKVETVKEIDWKRDQ